jgi:hypothetical protein
MDTPGLQNDDIQCIRKVFCKSIHLLLYSVNLKQQKYHIYIIILFTQHFVEAPFDTTSLEDLHLGSFSHSSLHIL